MVSDAIGTISVGKMQVLAKMQPIAFFFDNLGSKNYPSVVNRLGILQFVEWNILWLSVKAIGDFSQVRG
ncbi:MAG: hypothetical protein P5680_13240 [Limnospira sp. PMC 737.11]|uniref:hypothetical protein n=1 Tax=Limnospira sp. PMC 737.11 TaxID=2981095 RepID=UPI0028E0B805|nr:hypothetical protein [Limnospira sp. PMC 737.11]MDT9275561.1 hypothetical protein [Limnospira sp. PMC 737.11]